MSGSGRVLAEKLKEMREVSRTPDELNKGMAEAVMGTFPQIGDVVVRAVNLNKGKNPYKS